MAIGDIEVQRIDLLQQTPHATWRLRHLETDRLGLACHRRQGAQRQDRVFDSGVKRAGGHSRVVHRSDDRCDAGPVSAKLFKGAQLDGATRLAPQLANPATGLIEHGVGQLQELQAQPAADLDRSARSLKARQRRRLAPGDPPGVKPHPFDRDIGQRNPFGTQTPQFVDPFLDAADIPSAKTGDRCSASITMSGCASIRMSACG
jgi:hypothetical protein